MALVGSAMMSPGNRLGRLLRTFPGALRKSSLVYIRGLERRSPAQRYPGRTYWAVIPRLLVRSLPAGKNRRIRFLDDILWGQYCIFLYLRIHDDLLDGHVRGGRLHVAADLIFEEGEKAFARHFDRDAPFWQSFRSFHAATREAILALDILQRRRGPPQLLLRHYAEVSAVFKIALAAVCIRSGRWNQFKPIARCYDAIAVAGQILDDLQDVDEDLKRRRFNYVAAALDRKPESGTGRRALELSRALVYGDGTARIMREVTRHLHRAERALRGLRLPQVRRFLRTQRRTVGRLSHALQSRWISR